MSQPKEVYANMNLLICSNSELQLKIEYKITELKQWPAGFDS